MSETKDFPVYCVKGEENEFNCDEIRDSMPVCHEPVWAAYWYEYGDYEGDGEMVVFDGEYLYDACLGHCSCFGPMENDLLERLGTPGELFDDEVLSAPDWQENLVVKVRELLEGRTDGSS